MSTAGKLSMIFADMNMTLGFVIYRCTYASDTEWTECVRIVRSALSSILEFYGGLDLLESNPFTIFEDRSIFERAPAAVIRDHFESWAASACLQEQGTSYGSHWWVGSPRYRFCIQITEENLRNILDDKNDADENDGQVRLIRRSWKAQQGDDHERASDPVNILDEYTGVEGCTAYDVGWMNIRQNEYLSFYCRFQNSNIWQARYERPPLLAKVDGI
jgi:hypothetical protein